LAAKTFDQSAFVMRTETTVTGIGFAYQTEAAPESDNFCMSVHLDWANLIAGFVLGLAAALVYDWIKASAKAHSLHEKYGKLARTYSNFRADGTATGGSVKLTQKPDGSFEISGLNADRTVEWESVLWMDDKFDNVGTARYKYKAGMGYGVQIIRYFPELDILHVKGIRESGQSIEFFHEWRPRK